MSNKESLLKEEKVLAGKKGKVKHAIRNLIAEKNTFITEIGEGYLKFRKNLVSKEDFETKFLEVSKEIELADNKIAMKIAEKKSIYSELKEIEDKLETIS